MNCETCGELMEVRDVTAGEFTYVCPNGHWWLLSPTLGWLVIPEPTTIPNPNAAGAPF